MPVNKTYGWGTYGSGTYGGGEEGIVIPLPVTGSRSVFVDRGGQYQLDNGKYLFTEKYALRKEMNG